MNKTHKILSILLIILALDVLGILGFEIYKIYQKTENDRSEVYSQILDSKDQTSHPKIEVLNVPSQTAKILMVGDMMFDRYVRAKIKKEGLPYLFEHVTSYFSQYDMVLGNLEGTITSRSSIALDPNATSFTFDPSIAQALGEFGITHVSLGNNHSLDFGESAYTQTLQFLENNSIEYFGHALNTQNLSVETEIKGKKIAYVAYHQLFRPDRTPIIDEIHRLQNKVDYIVVFAHWGSEYKNIHNIQQENIAHELIDAGADLIVGAHPHVVQDVGIYNNVPIIYSLGNFIFDQADPVTHIGLMLGISYTDDEIILEFFPIKLIRMRPTLLEGEEKEEVFRTLANTSHLDNDMKDSIEQGKIQYSIKE